MTPHKPVDPPRFFDAWILDIMVNPVGILLWLKKPTGEVIAAIHPFHPSFYAVIPLRNRPSSSFQAKFESEPEQYQRFATMIGDNSYISKIEVCQRRVHAEDAELSSALRIEVNSPMHFKRVVQRIRQLEHFELYNTDLPLGQMFLYETRLFPFAKCKVSLVSGSSNSHIDYPQIRTISLVDSNEEIQYELPPLRVIWLELDISGQGLKPTKNDPLLACRLTVDPMSVTIPLATLFSPDQIMTDSHGAPQVRIVSSSERAVILGVQQAIQKIDPDVIFTSKGDEDLFPYLLARASYLNLAETLTFSRDGNSLKSSRFQVEGSDAFMSYGQILHRAQSQFYLGGRLHIDSAIYGGLHFDDGNLYGIIEVGRVSYTPLQRLTRITIGGSLQSLQFFQAYSLGVLIPEEKKNAEYFQTGANLLLSDRGGHILNPKIGLFERVAEMDYTSMYPSLMCQYNVSPETLNCKCCKETGHKVPGLPYHICKKRKGIVPLSLRVPLTKRIQYKHLSKTVKGPEGAKYKKMEEALKWILVVCFGYLGFRNARFGRIEAHQTVCAYAREFLLNAQDIVERHGCTPVHGIVDCLWIQAPLSVSNVQFDLECQQIVTEIQAKTQIPIGYDPKGDCYEFICFLPTKADPVIGALNRYWGKKMSGGFKIRGLEMRRHDAPPLVKHFQEELMDAIGKVSNKQSIPILLRCAIYPTLIKYYTYLENGQATVEDLAITTRVTRSPDQYKVQNYQAIASAYLERNGVPVSAGQSVSYIIMNDKAKNPQERVMPRAVFERMDRSYDVRKYKELLVRALINLLPFTIPAELRKNLEMISIPTFRKQTQIQTSLESLIKHV